MLLNIFLMSLTIYKYISNNLIIKPFIINYLIIFLKKKTNILPLHDNQNKILNCNFHIKKTIIMQKCLKYL